MKYVFRTPDHPEANGCKPRHGEEAFPFTLPTDDGGKVVVHLGRVAFRNHAATLLAMLKDNPDLLQEAGVIAKEVLDKIK